MKYQKQEIAFAFRKFEFDELQGRIIDLDSMIKKLLLTQKSDRVTITGLNAQIRDRDKAIERVEAKSQDAFAIIAGLEKQLAAQVIVIKDLKQT